MMILNYILAIGYTVLFILFLLKKFKPDNFFIGVVMFITVIHFIGEIVR